MRLLFQVTWVVAHLTAYFIVWRILTWLEWLTMNPIWFALIMIFIHTLAKEAGEVWDNDPNEN